jgi:hypothetical protein
MHSTITMTAAVFLSHNGLGDSLFSVGALRYLSTLYTHILFLCKDIYYDNVVLMLSDCPTITVVPFQSNNEFAQCRDIVTQYYQTHDILVCGCHRRYLSTQITHPSLVNHSIDDGDYDLAIDTMTNERCSFIKSFYADINLGLRIFYEHFALPSTAESRALYESVKEFRVIFIQTTASYGNNLNITSLVNKNIEDDRTILISSSENLYPEEHPKHAVCKRFVMNKIVYYLDTIRNAEEIYCIDSCFVGVIMPLKKMGKLKASIVRVICRDLVNTISV